MSVPTKSRDLSRHTIEEKIEGALYHSYKKKTRIGIGADYFVTYKIVSRIIFI